MTRETNPYVTGPTLDRHPCNDTEDHFPHIERDAEREFLCDGINPGSAVAIARHRAVLLAMGKYDEPGPDEEPSVFDEVAIDDEPVLVDPGPGTHMESDERAHARIDWNMTNHAPANDDVIARFEAVREFAKAYSHAVVDLCPPSRDRDLALEHVEDSLMRAVASIARNQSRLESFLPDSFADSVTDPVFAPAPGPRCTCARMPAAEGDETVLVIDEDCPDHFPAEQGVKTKPFETADDLEAAAAEALNRPDTPLKERTVYRPGTEPSVQYVGAPNNDPTEDQKVEFGDGEDDA